MENKCCSGKEAMMQKVAQESQNKAGYTATPVACGWAGAIFEVT